jgi:hypothetical protein
MIALRSTRELTFIPPIWVSESHGVALLLAQDMPPKFGGRPGYMFDGHYHNGIWVASGGPTNHKPDAHGFRPCYPYRPRELHELSECRTRRGLGNHGQSPMEAENREYRPAGNKSNTSCWRRVTVAEKATGQDANATYEGWLRRETRMYGTNGLQEGVARTLLNLHGWPIYCW